VTIGSTTPADRSLLRRVFISPDEPRLRAGWRLLIHTLLLVIFLLTFSTIIGIAGVALGLIDLSSLNGGMVAMVVQTLAMLLSITLATWLARRFLDRRSFVSLGFRFDRRMTLDLVFGFLVPGVLFALIYAFEAGMGWLTYQGTAVQDGAWTSAVWGLLGGLALFIIVGYQEELLSRGYHLQNLVDGLNLPLGLILSSSVFALLHLANPSADWVSTAGILFAGLFLAYGWVRTGQLWLSIGLHIGWNFFEGTVYGFPVSGTGGFNFIHQVVNGPKLITGGGFGPEAGLVVLPALALGTVAIWWYTRGRSPSVASDNDPDEQVQGPIPPAPSR
jgi:membrane protease YdiL (CAAX protease family)